MYQAEVVYLDSQTDSLDFDKKPSIDVKGNNVVLDAGNGQKFLLAVNSFLWVKLTYPEEKNLPFRYSTDLRYCTKNEKSEYLLTANEPKFDVKTFGNNGNVIIVKENDNVIRIVNGEWLESLKVNFFSDTLTKDLGKKK